LLLTSLGDESDSSPPDITFQCSVCEILANCCERVKVRKLFRKTKGLVRVLKFLLLYQGFFDSYKKAIKQADPNTYNQLQSGRPRGSVTPGRSNLSSTGTPQTGRSSSRRGSILRLDNLQNVNRKLSQKLLIIYNASRVLWKASKSSTYRFKLLTM
jgi:hypothetical protein